MGKVDVSFQRVFASLQMRLHEQMAAHLVVLVLMFHCVR
jgi:hypothetical protein